MYFAARLNGKAPYNKFYYREAFCYNREISVSQQTACLDGDLLMGPEAVFLQAPLVSSLIPMRNTLSSLGLICVRRGRGRADRRPRCLQTFPLTSGTDPQDVSFGEKLGNQSFGALFFKL